MRFWLFCLSYGVAMETKWDNVWESTLKTKKHLWLQSCTAPLAEKPCFSSFVAHRRKDHMLSKKSEDWEGTVHHEALAKSMKQNTWAGYLHSAKSVPFLPYYTSPTSRFQVDSLGVIPSSLCHYP